MTIIAATAGKLPQPELGRLLDVETPGVQNSRGTSDLSVAYQEGAAPPRRRAAVVAAA
eukprot:CAMPEP_0183475906 /NCGR_PEP_ID=MMETSP0370-20130417/165572_1 /TAXON_ID=268820 /ORGANISM="Peridinium aciculiferum, Strain PAER-2" /LENGTH=57 /DNA_ID=CAMNT_0025668721 /DNA_START=33 /DNA_END=202 /DNA_ORIENTATION=-